MSSVMEDGIDGDGDNEAQDLIAYLSIKCKGIGKKKAAGIAVYFDDLQTFLNASLEDLRNYRKSNGLQILRNSEIQELLAMLIPIKRGMPTRETWVFVLIRDFMENVRILVEASKVPTPAGALDENALLINPFLIRALGLTQPDEVLRFFFYQRVTRSIVTSWGMRIESIANRSGAIALTKAEKAGRFKGFDSRKTEGDTTYLIQIKSGTDTMPVDMVRQLDERIKALEAIDERYRGLLGLTYGNAKEVSSKISSYLEGAKERVKAGREFWEWLSGDPGFYSKLQNMIAEIGKEIWTEGDFQKMFDDKFESLRQEWIALYGGGPESVDKFMARFS